MLTFTNRTPSKLRKMAIENCYKKQSVENGKLIFSWLNHEYSLSGKNGKYELLHTEGSISASINLEISGNSIVIVNAVYNGKKLTSNRHLKKFEQLGIITAIVTAHEKI